MNKIAKGLFFFFLSACVAQKASLPEEIRTQGHSADPEIWSSWGGNLENTHQAINSPEITPDNVSRLQVKWIYETKGDISAIPAITKNYLYFPDWGVPYIGTAVGGSYLHAVERKNGKALWSRAIISYSKNLMNNIVRNSFAIAGDLIIFGDNRGLTNSILSLPGAHGATLYAVNRFTGDLVWHTVLDTHPLSIVTQSPVIYKNRVYIGTSSNEEAAARFIGDCCSFRGAMLALDLQSGKIVWKTSMAPPSKEKDGFTGNSIWGSQPTIDTKRGSVYVATGNNYSLPKNLEKCLKDLKAKDRSECFKKFDAMDNYASSVLALDLETGAVKWSRKLENFGAWTYACEPTLAPVLPTKDKNCEDPDSDDFDFGQGPMLLQTESDGKNRQILAIGQKSGVFWAFDPDQGRTLWSTKIGPGGTLGGMEFGSATDGKLIYAAITNFGHIPFQLSAGPEAGKTVNGGIWAGIDAATGTILWQTADPSSEKPLKGSLSHTTFGGDLGEGFFGVAKGPLTVAHGVVFGGSMDREGHMYALSAKDGKILWRFESGGSVMSAPAIVDNILYWGSGYSKTGFKNNKVYAFELKVD